MRWHLIKAVGLAIAAMAAPISASAMALEQQRTAGGAPPSSESWVRTVSATADRVQETHNGARVLWAQRPTPALLGGLYPQQALRDGVSGRVELHCIVLADLSAACALAREWPPGHGFGEAALSASAHYRARPTLSDGASAVGARARIAVAFYPPQ